MGFASIIGEPVRLFRSSENDIEKEFYVPFLKKTKTYKRGVGYFSSSFLEVINEGIIAFEKNKGRIQLIVSPEITDDDIEQIELGYSIRDIIQSKTDELDFSNAITRVEDLDTLARLIAEGILEIKVAIKEKNGVVQTGKYHEKIGVLVDENENRIAYIGSSNETRNALKENLETIAVFYGWLSSYESSNTCILEKYFDESWNNQTPGFQVYTFPEAAKKSLISKIIQAHEALRVQEREGSNIVPRQYQLEAIANWFANEEKGIFDMATGTGKTVTALLLSEKLFKQEGRLSIIVVCPYQFLVEQWGTEAKLFKYNPVLCYSQSENRNWKTDILEELRKFELGIKDVICHIYTLATFSSDFVQGIMPRYHKSTLIVVDEVHHIGAPKLRTKMPSMIVRRLGLSATVQREGDDVGNGFITSYFSGTVFTYNLVEAINNGYLVRYDYKPIVVQLSKNTWLEYCDITKKIASLDRKAEEYDERLKRLLIARARLVAGEQNKIAALEKTISEEGLLNTYHNLIYCGSTQSIEEYEDYSEEMRQIDVVIKHLTKEPFLQTAQKFTAEETRIERQMIRDNFDKGIINFLVAIRCLDEGFNIPGIGTAIILASSTVSREFVQRRGRILRNAKGKKKAVIYDFISVPDTEYLSTKDESTARNLVRREIDRISEYMNPCENSTYVLRIVRMLREKYDLDRIGG